MDEMLFLHKKYEFFERLGNYVDLERFIRLDEKIFDKLKEYFDNERIYEKMGYTYSKVTNQVKIKTMMNDCKEFLELRKKDAAWSEKLCKEVKPYEKQGTINDSVIFLYFLLMENNCIFDRKNNLDLFKYLSDVFGYKFDRKFFEIKESFILFCVIKWKKNIYEFNNYLMEEWEEYGDLESIIEGLTDDAGGNSEILVGDFIDRIEELCKSMEESSNVRATRSSVKMSIRNVKTIEKSDDDIKPKQGEKFLDFCKNHEEYSQILTMIQNTEPRRRWYLYRILEKIVIKQIEYVKSKCSSFSEMAETMRVVGISKTTMVNPFYVLYLVNDDEMISDAYTEEQVDAELDEEDDIRKKANIVYNYPLFFGFHYGKCSNALKEAKKYENKRKFELAARCILDLYHPNEAENDNIYKINSEAIGKLKKYAKELKGDIKKEIDAFFEIYKDKTENEDIENIIRNGCYMKISDIVYIFETIFDDKIYHYEENEDTILQARLTDDWIKRSLARGFSDDKIMEIAKREGIGTITLKKINNARKYLSEHYTTVIDSDGNKGHGIGIRQDSVDGKLFKRILVGRANVSRELLLSFVLLAKVYSVIDEISWDYIRFHILENSRFDKSTEKNTPFNDFYINAVNDLNDGKCEFDNETVYLTNLYSRAAYISDKAEQMEIKYLGKGVAPFEVMFAGGVLD